MPAPLLLDLTHTSHTRARTGIQRVARSLREALGEQAIPFTHDPHARVWRLLRRWETANLETSSAAAKRGAKWPLHARLRGLLARQPETRVDPALAAVAAQAEGLLEPEIFSPEAVPALPALFHAARGPRVALFHDAIALRFPEHTPTKTVARFPAYLRELLAFDGIAAISADSAASIVEYWQWLGVTNPPPVANITLGVSAEEFRVAPLASTQPPDPGEPVVLCVASLEGRKNHLALLEACELLWARGTRFTLHLIGLAQAQTGAAALARLRALQAAGRPLRYDGAVSDAAVAQAFAACTFTVYPSFSEGFGLPVLESVAAGKPCICSARGPVGESARGGGCVALASVAPPALAEAIADLLAQPQKLAALTAEARARKFKTFRDYVADLTGWMRTVRRRG